MGPEASRPSAYAAYAPSDASGRPDDDILEKQIQADLESQIGSQSLLVRIKSSKKRRSHDSEDGSERTKKRRRKKDRTVQHLTKGLNEVSSNGELRHEKKKRKSKSLGATTRDKPRDDDGDARNPPRDTTSSMNGPLIENVAGYQSISTEVNDTSFKSGDKRVTNSPFYNGQLSRSSPAQATHASSRSDALMRTVLSGCTGAKQNGSAGSKRTESEPPKRSSPVSSAKAESTPVAVRVDERLKKQQKDSKRYSLVPVLPQGYKIGPPDQKKRHHCPVVTCRTSYTRSTGLGMHMHRDHGGEILNDNGDGTFSIISAEEDVLGPVEMTSSLLNGHPLPRIISHAEEILHSAKKSPAEMVQYLSKELLGSKRLQTEKGSVIANGRDIQNRYANKSVAVKPKMAVETSSEADSSDDDSPEDNSSDEEPLARSRTQISPSAVSSAKTKRITPPSSGESTGEHLNGKMDMNGSNEELATKTQAHRKLLPKFTKEKQSKHRLSTGQRQRSTSEVLSRENSGSVMEEWEFSNGRLPETAQPVDSNSPETNHSTFAFSSKYINQSKSVWVSPEVSFQTQHLLGGESHLWSDDKHYLRICSVASGKVQVTMGEEIFSIGAHGMWKIPAGERCSASNRSYAEAVIHVSSVLED